MIEVKIIETESEYRRLWGAYWLFWLKVRYGKKFVAIILAGFILTSGLLTLAHPELGLYPLLAIFSIILFITPIVALFDYYRYRQYLKRIINFYKQQEYDREYELRFDEHEVFINGQRTVWKDYRYYYTNKQYVYIFKTKNDIALILSQGGGINLDAYNFFAAYAKSNLKILPSSKQILFH